MKSCYIQFFIDRWANFVKPNNLVTPSKLFLFHNVHSNQLYLGFWWRLFDLTVMAIEKIKKIIVILRPRRVKNKTFMQRVPCEIITNHSFPSPFFSNVLNCFESSRINLQRKTCVHSGVFLKIPFFASFVSLSPQKVHKTAVSISDVWARHESIFCIKRDGAGWW